MIVLPYLGVFAYLIARGRTMGDRLTARGPTVDPAQRAYVREVEGSMPSPSLELERLVDLRASGAIDAPDAVAPARPAAPTAPGASAPPKRDVYVLTSKRSPAEAHQRSAT